MPLAYKSDQITNKQLRPPVSPQSAREIYRTMFSAVLDNQHALNDLIGLAVLPPDCLPTDCLIYVGDIDTATALVWSAGIVNAAVDDLVTGSNLITGSTVGQAAGFQAPNVHNGIFLPATWLADAASPAAHAEKTFAMKITTAAGTPAAGSIYGWIDYRAMEFGA